MTIELSSRLTLLAGHNGIGKSTILGLLTNTFGITDAGVKNYFGDPFYANIEKIVYLGLDEVDIAQENPASAPVVLAEVDGLEVRKRCAMTRRGVWRRARVVPRTVDKLDADEVGQDAKIPLPTIYLGIRRLASIGEADEKEVSSTSLSMHTSDVRLMMEFISSVILGSQVTDAVTYQSIKGSRKRTAHPGYQGHDALAVSMGQDSLGSIATALASFNKLKRDLGSDYAGGLLVIDELDVGFHPHAIVKLAAALKTYARRLRLQIVATTHSPRLIEAVHPDGPGDVQSPDKVVYLLDTRKPMLAPDQSLEAILNDMSMNDQGAPTAKRRTTPLLCVYFEDPQSAQFCEALIPTAVRTRLGKKYGVRLRIMPLSIGGSHIVSLPEKDPIFKDRVLVVDADTKISAIAAKRGNTLKLPCVHGAAGTDRSPENTIRKFLIEISDSSRGPLHEALLRMNVSNPSRDKLINAFLDDPAVSTQRGAAKTWWEANWTKLQRWGVIERWAEVYAAEAGVFAASFESAVASTAMRLKS